MYFAYGTKETDYLSRKDKRLAAAIAQIGPIEREVDTDLFAAVVHHIIGQQISMKAQATIWQRMRDALGTVDAEHLLAAGGPQLQQLGMTFRKAEYITDFSQKIHDGTFDLQAVWQMPDDEAIRALSSLKGIGVWTAEMILLFCMQRPDVFSYDDLAIQRGLRMLYHHRKIDRKLFEKLPPPVQPLRQRRQPLSLGHLRRCHPRDAGLRAKKASQIKKKREQLCGKAALAFGL